MAWEDFIIGVVAVAVTDDDTALYFLDGDTTTRSTLENSPAGTDIGEPVSAEDPEGGTLTYSLAGDDADLFSLDTANGQLSVVSGVTLDYENPGDQDGDNDYEVTLTVTDPNNDTDTIDVTVSVTNDPEGTYWAGSITLASSIGDTHGAGDRFSGSSIKPRRFRFEGADLRIKIFSWTPAPTSSVSASTTWGEITPAADGLWLPEAIHSHSPTRPSTKIPFWVIAMEVAAMDISEDAADSTDVGEPVVATDPDAADTLTYALSGTGSTNFTIDANRQITVATGAAQDHETTSSYSLSATVHDGKNADGNADSSVDDTIAVTINVTDVDDAGSVSLNSDQPRVGTELTATLNDEDAGVSNTTWQWARSADGVSNWGDIASATSASYSPVDADVNQYLRATASYDDTHSTGKSVTAVSANSVQAAPVVKSEPSFDDGDNTTRSIAENSAEGTTVGDPVAATDSDDGDILTYAISGDGAANFTIDSDGQITVATGTTLDHENTPSYSLSATVRDGKDSDGNPDTSVDDTIAVTNVDEAPVLSGSTSIDYAENGSNAVATYTASDPEGQTGITWSLTGADSGDFTLTGRVLTFVSLPNYEDPQDADIGNDYQVTITAADPTSNLATLEVVINVTDSDEPGSVSPNSDQPQVGAELTATLNDEDAGVSNTAWQWARSSDGVSNWGNIAGATSALYVPVDADVNQ